MTQNEEGHYEISFLWVEDKPHLPDNLCVAKKWLTIAAQKLLANKIYEGSIYRMVWQ